MSHETVLLSSEEDRQKHREAVRRQELVDIARELFEEKGLAKTTVKDIALRSGLSRGAIYYYFEDKDALIDAVIEDYVAEFGDMLEIWENTRPKGDPSIALKEFVLLIKRATLEKSDLRIDLSKNENAGLYARFVSKAIRNTIGRLDETTIKYYAKHYTIEIDHLHEMFYVLLAGMSTYLRNNPHADVDKMTEVAAQILRIDLHTKLPESEIEAIERMEGSDSE